jgi:uncharacterized caspase-like protein
MTTRMKVLAVVMAVLTAALAPFAVRAQQAAQNPRIALVIGNATYRDAALATTANDAGLIAQTLQAAGFDVVGARDLDGQSLRTAFRDFLDKASAAGPDMQAFVYLAGRGLQYDGDNYFVPVDAQINRDADVPIDALRISDFAHALAQTPGRARIIVLDAARANPYGSQGSPLAPGLALVDPEPGELIAFNAAPGTLAGEEQGPYGVYGKTLAGAMRQGGVRIEDVFDQTRVTVNQDTQGALIPWSASKLGEPYYVFERAAGSPPPAAAAAPPSSEPIAGLPAEAAYAAALQRDSMRGYEEYLTAYPDGAQARRVRAILAARREASYWRRSVNANTAHAYWTYLRAYPKGPHVWDARRRLAMISAAYEPPPDFAPMVYQDLPPPPPDEGFYEAQPFYAFDAFGPSPEPPPPQYYQDYYYVEDDDWRDLPPPPPPSAVGYLSVLPLGIPLVVGAVAFQHYNAYNRSGIAPAGAPRFRSPPPAPPPLPRNVTPVQPPAPIPVRTAQPEARRVKPLPPIGASAPLGTGAPSATPAVVGKPPAAATPTPAAGGKLPPLAPVAPAPITPPTGGAAAPSGAKLPGVATPPAGGNLPTVSPVAPALPTPATGGAPPPSGGKLPSVAPPPAGGKLPTVSPVAPVPLTPTTEGAPPPSGAKLPGVVTPPAGGKPLPSVAPAPGKALPVAPLPGVAAPTTPITTPPRPPGPVPTAAPAQRQILSPRPAVNPPSVVPVAPPSSAGHAPAPPPIVHAPPQPAAIHAPPAPPPVVPAPPPPPPPVVHAPPAPPPVVHAPPPPPPVVHAPPPQPPVVRAPPAAVHAPACGGPGLPPCPK